jgi:hypothetical protein
LKSCLKFDDFGPGQAPGPSGGFSGGPKRDVRRDARRDLQDHQRHDPRALVDHLCVLSLCLLFSFVSFFFATSSSVRFCFFASRGRMRFCLASRGRIRNFKKHEHRKSRGTFSCPEVGLGIPKQMKIENLLAPFRVRNRIRKFQSDLRTPTNENPKSVHPKCSSSDVHFRRSSVHPRFSSSEVQFFRRSLQTKFSSSEVQFIRMSIHPKFNSSKFQFTRSTIHPKFSSAEVRFSRNSVHPKFSSSEDHFIRRDE